MIKPVRSEQVRSSLAAKGFKASNKDGDHEMFFFWHKGKKTGWWVKLSHGVEAIRQDEIRNNARPLGLSGDDLHSILACNHDYAKVIALYEGLHGAEDDASCPSAEHADSDNGVPVVDSKSRPWHRECAARQLQSHPWTFGRTACPACGGDDGERTLMDSGRRLWHAVCAGRALGDS